VRAVGQVRSQAAPGFALRQGDFDREAYKGDANALRVAPDDARVCARRGAAAHLQI
jgi:hypothetical protein